MGFSIWKDYIFCRECTQKSYQGLVVLGSKTSTESDETPYLVASASSDGTVWIWDTRMVGTENPILVFEIDSKERITFLPTSTINTIKRHKSSLDDKDTKSKIKNSNPKGSSLPALTKKKKFKKCLGIEGEKDMKKKDIEKSLAN